MIDYQYVAKEDCPNYPIFALTFCPHLSLPAFLKNIFIQLYCYQQNGINIYAGIDPTAKYVQTVGYKSNYFWLFMSAMRET